MTRRLIYTTAITNDEEVTKDTQWMVISSTIYKKTADQFHKKLGTSGKWGDTAFKHVKRSKYRGIILQ